MSGNKKNKTLDSIIGFGILGGLAYGGYKLHQKGILAKAVSSVIPKSVPKTPEYASDFLRGIRSADTQRAVTNALNRASVYKKSSDIILGLPNSPGVAEHVSGMKYRRFSFNEFASPAFETSQKGVISQSLKLKRIIESVQNKQDTMALMIDTEWMNLPNANRPTLFQMAYGKVGSRDVYKAYIRPQELDTPIARLQKIFGDRPNLTSSEFFKALPDATRVDIEVFNTLRRHARTSRLSMREILNQIAGTPFRSPLEVLSGAEQKVGGYNTILGRSLEDFRRLQEHMGGLIEQQELANKAIDIQTAFRSGKIYHPRGYLKSFLSMEGLYGGERSRGAVKTFERFLSQNKSKYLDEAFRIIDIATGVGSGVTLGALGSHEAAFDVIKENAMFELDAENLARNLSKMLPEEINKRLTNGFLIARRSIKNPLYGKPGEKEWIVNRGGIYGGLRYAEDEKTAIFTMQEYTHSKSGQLVPRGKPFEVVFDSPQVARGELIGSLETIGKTVKKGISQPYVYDYATKDIIGLLTDPNKFYRHIIKGESLRGITATSIAAKTGYSNKFLKALRETPAVKEIIEKYPKILSEESRMGQMLSGWVMEPIAEALLDFEHGGRVMPGNFLKGFSGKIGDKEITFSSLNLGTPDNVIRASDIGRLGVTIDNEQYSLYSAIKSGKLTSRDLMEISEAVKIPGGVSAQEDFYAHLSRITNKASEEGFKVYGEESFEPVATRIMENRELYWKSGEVGPVVVSGGGIPGLKIQTKVNEQGLMIQEPYSKALERTINQDIISKTIEANMVSQKVSQRLSIISKVTKALEEQGLSESLQYATDIRPGIGGLHVSFMPNTQLPWGAATEEYGLEAFIPLQYSEDFGQTFEYISKGTGRPVRGAFRDVVVPESEYLEYRYKPPALRLNTKMNIRNSEKLESVFLIRGEDVAKSIAKEQIDRIRKFKNDANKLFKKYSAGGMSIDTYRRRLIDLRRNAERQINNILTSGILNHGEYVLPGEEGLVTMNLSRVLKSTNATNAQREAMIAEINKLVKGVYTIPNKPYHLGIGASMREYSILGYPIIEGFKERLIPGDIGTVPGLPNLRLSSRAIPEEVNLSHLGMKRVNGSNIMFNRVNARVAVPVDIEAHKVFFGEGEPLQDLLFSERLENSRFIRSIIGKGQLSGIKIDVEGLYKGIGKKGTLPTGWDLVVGDVLYPKGIIGKHARLNKVKEGIINRIMRMQNEGVLHKDTFKLFEQQLSGTGLKISGPDGLQVVIDEIKRKKVSPNGINYNEVLDLTPEQKTLLEERLSLGALEDLWERMNQKNIAMGKGSIGGLYTTYKGQKFLELELGLGLSSEYTFQELTASLPNSGPRTIPSIKDLDTQGIRLRRADIFTISGLGRSKKLAEIIGKNVALASATKAVFVDQYLRAALGLMGGNAPGIKTIEYNEFLSILNDLSDYDKEILNEILEPTGRVLQRGEYSRVSLQKIFGLRENQILRVVNTPTSFKPWWESAEGVSSAVFLPTRGTMINGEMQLQKSSRIGYRLLKLLSTPREAMDAKRFEALSRGMFDAMVEELAGKRGLVSGAYSTIELGSRELWEATPIGEVGLLKGQHPLTTIDPAMAEAFAAEGIEITPDTNIIHPATAVKMGLFTEEQLATESKMINNYVLRYPLSGVATSGAKGVIPSFKVAEKIQGFEAGPMYASRQLIRQIGGDSDGDRAFSLFALARGNKGENAISKDVQEGIEALINLKYEILGKAYEEQGVSGFDLATKEGRMQWYNTLEEASKLTTGNAEIDTLAREAAENVFGSQRVVAEVGNIEKEFLARLSHFGNPMYTPNAEEYAKTMIALSEIKETFIKQFKPGSTGDASVGASFSDMITQRIEYLKTPGAQPYVGASADNMIEYLNTLLKTVKVQEAEYAGFNLLGNVEVVDQFARDLTPAQREKLLQLLFQQAESGIMAPEMFESVKTSLTAAESEVVGDAQLLLSKVSQKRMADIGKAASKLMMIALPLSVLDMAIKASTGTSYKPSRAKARSFAPPDSDYYRTIIDTEAIDYGDLNSDELKAALSNNIKGNTSINIRDNRQEIRRVIDEELRRALKGRNQDNG